MSEGDEEQQLESRAGAARSWLSPRRTAGERGSDAAEAGTEPVDDADAVPAAPRRTVVVALAVLCGVFLVGAIVLGAIAANLHSQLDDERSGRREVERVASRFGERFFTYDYRHLDQSKAAVLALATGGFRNDYEQAFKGGLDEILTRTQARSTGTVDEVLVGGVEKDSASAVVVADAVVEGVSGTRRRTNSYIQLDLVKVRGHWLVDKVTDLEVGLGTSAPTAGTVPPTTTTRP